MRASKKIGSSLEADICIKLKEDYFDISKNIDFSEICITSLARTEKLNYSEKDIIVETNKAKGKKCNVCWKIREEECERHGKCEVV